MSLAHLKIQQNIRFIYNFNGGLAERSNAAVLKTALRGTVTGVRIPEPPQKNKSGGN